MGLDLIAEGCAKPGHETEWREIVERAFDGASLTEAESSRFSEISIPSYERVGAPRVGFDPAADAWIIKARNASTSDEVAQALKDFHGYHVVALADCDGTPIYSNGGQYDGVDETSFRGSVLALCGTVLSKALIDKAWDHKLPDAAVAYGRELLDAARTAKPVEPKRGLLARLGLGGGSRDQLSFEDQVEAVEAAGRWFVYWGERGHPIRAWY